MLRTTGQSERLKKVEMESSHNCTSDSVSDYKIRVRKSVKNQSERKLGYKNGHFTHSITDEQAEKGIRNVLNGAFICNSFTQKQILVESPLQNRKQII